MVDSGGRAGRGNRKIHQHNKRMAVIVPGDGHRHYLTCRSGHTDA